MKYSALDWMMVNDVVPPDERRDVREMMLVSQLGKRYDEFHRVFICKMNGDLMECRCRAFRKNGSNTKYHETEYSSYQAIVTVNKAYVGRSNEKNFVKAIREAMVRALYRRNSAGPAGR